MSLRGPMDRLAELPAAPEDPWWVERVEGAPDGTVLYLGAGTGRAALALASACDDLVAVESDPAMVRVLARRAANQLPVGDRLHPVNHDPATVDLDRAFDLVVVAPVLVNGCADPSRRVAVARNAGQHVRPGGEVVLEVLDPYWLAAAGFGAEGELAAAGGTVRAVISDVAFDVWEQQASATITHRLPDGEELVDLFRATALYPRELRALAYQAGLELMERAIPDPDGAIRTWRLVARRLDRGGQD